MTLMELRELYPLMVPELRKCPKPYLLQHLQRICRDFAKRTNAFREEISVDLVVGQREYVFRSSYPDTLMKELFRRPLYRGALLEYDAYSIRVFSEADVYENGVLPDLILTASEHATLGGGFYNKGAVHHGFAVYADAAAEFFIWAVDDSNMEFRISGAVGDVSGGFATGPEITGVFECHGAWTGTATVTDEIEVSTTQKRYGLEVVLGFDPDVDEAEGLTIDAVLMPALFVRALPAEFLDLYGEGLAAGALASLMGMSHKPWHDPETAEAKFADYMDTVSDALDVVATGRTGRARTLGA